MAVGYITLITARLISTNASRRQDSLDRQIQWILLLNKSFHNCSILNMKFHNSVRITIFPPKTTSLSKFRFIWSSRFQEPNRYLTVHFRHTLEAYDYIKDRMANNTETVVGREPTEVQMETTTAEVVHAIESQPQPVSIQPTEETTTNSIVVSQAEPQSPTPTQTLPQARD